MADSTLSQAIKEAYAAAPAGVVIYHTLELRHSAFTQPIRVVRDFVDLLATLEPTAPLNPSTLVTFVGFNFDFSKPEVSDTGVPQITIEIDNADRGIVAAIESTMGSTEMIQVTYREFISTDLSGPQNNPPLTMTITNITADSFRVKATAGFPNLTNRRFPTVEYDPAIFVGLTQ